jgi:hypothetical protein
MQVARTMTVIDSTFKWDTSAVLNSRFKFGFQCRKIL